MVAFSFDATTVAPSTGVSNVFDDGDYLFIIRDTKVAVTKSNTGTMLVIDYICDEEGHKGKTYTARLNVKNNNPEAQRIAYAELSAICHVTGKLRFNDTEELHGARLKLRLTKVPRDDDPSKFNNNTLAYMDVNGNPPGASAQAPTAPVPPAPMPQQFQAPGTTPVPPAPVAPAPAAPVAQVPPAVAAPPVAPPAFAAPGTPTPKAPWEQ